MLDHFCTFIAEDAVYTMLSSSRANDRFEAIVALFGMSSSAAVVIAPNGPDGAVCLLTKWTVCVLGLICHPR